METIISREHMNEAKEVLEFIGTLDESEKKELIAFIQGAKFARQLELSMKTA